MEWTDTLMLDSSSIIKPVPEHLKQDFVQVVPLEGITLLTAEIRSREQATAALKLLRGFRATGRRVVLCDTSQMTVGKQLGHEIVEHGGADLLVSCGISGREVGIGARDAGLDLASVVVCGKPVAGSHVLLNQLSPGDTVLLLGLDEIANDEILKLLRSRLAQKSVLAA